MGKDSEPKRNSWWSENAAAIIYTGIGALVTIPVALLGASFSMSRSRTTESLENTQRPTIDLRTPSPMPSVEATEVLFKS